MIKNQITLVILLIIGTNFCQAQKLESVEKQIDSLISNRTIPSIAVGILKNGKVIYEKAFGYSDIRSETKATIHTPYQLASLTKPITAQAILQLHGEGVINLEDPITKYVSLKKVDSSFEDPTIRQVLNHTAGLGTYFDIFYEDEIVSHTSFEQAWEKYGTQFHQPGKVCEYSNLGYGLLSYIIGKVSGLSYQNYLKQKVFQPLNMENSYMIDQQSTVATKYDHRQNPLPYVWNNTSGAGNIASSISDLMKYAAFMMEDNGFDKVLFKEPNALFHYYESTYYGLGWYVMEDDHGQLVIWHEGGMMGASTMLKFHPKQNLAIAMVTNTSNNQICRNLTDQIAKTFITGYDPTPINEIADYQPIAADTSFFGSWQGTLQVEEQKVPISISINEEGVSFSYINFEMASYLTDYQPLPYQSKLLFGVINQNYLIGTGTGELPASDVRKGLQHILSLKLYKDGETLKGTIVSMAAAYREYYAHPFYIELNK